MVRRKQRETGTELVWFQTLLRTKYAHALITHALAFFSASACVISACAYFVRRPGGVGHDHVCAIFADSAPSNVCEFPIIGDRGISADIC